MSYRASAVRWALTISSRFRRNTEASSFLGDDITALDATQAVSSTASSFPHSPPLNAIVLKISGDPVRWQLKMVHGGVLGGQAGESHGQELPDPGLCADPVLGR